MGERRTWLLFATVLVIASAGIVYELALGALASYVLGDSVTQFSLVIGGYLSAMGLGAYLSRFVDDGIERVFCEVELATAIAGGCSVPLLFVVSAYSNAFELLLYAEVALVGTLVGIELPLLIRILRARVELKELLARALTFDYVGALFGSVLFSILLVPRLGLVRTSLAFGLLNAVVGFTSTYLLDGGTGKLATTRLRAAFVGALLALGLSQSSRISSFAEQAHYVDDVVLTRQTAYQHVTVTRGATTFNLFLDGNLQFSSGDEYRYHEALVHPAFAVADHGARVLILGGGDGLAAREVLRYPGVESITLVDLDPQMTELGRNFAPLRSLNQGSLSHPKMTVVNTDAMVWLGASTGKYDVVIADFPDPNNFALGKLYTTRFYRLAKARLSEGGAFVVQSTSPLFARTAFWCIVRTLREAGFSARPYHAFVPSFGEWGFVLAKTMPFDVPKSLRIAGLRWLDDSTLPTLFVLGVDADELPVEANHLNNQALVHYYEREWRKWN